MPIPRETILQALLAALETVPGTTILREGVLPERVPLGGLVILRDGNPGTPEVMLSPLSYSYEHKAELEVIVQSKTPAARAAAFDTLVQNQALDRLDSIVQLSVISRALTVPPATPAEGDRYIVAAGATGAWAGWDDSVVEFIGGAWARLIPRTGWLALDQAVGGVISYDANTGWAPLQTSVSKFTGLSDTPADLAGQAGKILQVNSGETALEFVTPATGGGAAGPVTYNPFQKRVAIPLASQFPTARSTTGAAGTITDDPVNGLTVSSTSGTEAARLITAKALPANWEVIEFAIASNQSTVT